MYISVMGTEVYYESRINPDSAVTAVILHGWGASCDAVRGIYNNLLACNRSAVMFDFPGFGKSGLPGKSWGVYDYAEMTLSLLEKLNIINPVLIGHSFGGRVALILAAQGKCKAQILVDAAGLKPKFDLKKKLKVGVYKFKKRFKLLQPGKKYGSEDYSALAPQMKPVFVRVVNRHLDKLLPQIKVPTLIIWGECDKDTPLYMAKRLNKAIADSGLCVLRGCGHFSYADNYPSFNKITEAFLQQIGENG